MDLPSATAAKDFVRGDMSALPRVIGWTLMRAVLIGAGIALAGERKHLVRYAVAGAGLIEVWILGWAWINKDEPPKANSLGQLRCGPGGPVYTQNGTLAR